MEYSIMIVQSHYLYDSYISFISQYLYLSSTTTKKTKGNHQQVDSACLLARTCASLPRSFCLQAHGAGRKHLAGFSLLCSLAPPPLFSLFTTCQRFSLFADASVPPHMLLPSALSAPALLMGGLPGQHEYLWFCLFRNGRGSFSGS